MGKYIKYYKTDEQYQEEKDKLILPNVSYTEDDNMVYYSPDKTSDEDKYEFVDMGLSVDWATCNIGATKPEEYGWYFMWGGTTPYNSDRTPVEGGDAVNFYYNSNCPYWVSGTSDNNTKWSKYTDTDDYSSTGTADKKLILDIEDDAAHVLLGGKCRMPTYEEYQELIDACNTKWVTNYNDTGINGRLFTLKTDPSKTLFFPASGNLKNASLKDVGSWSYNWSSSIYRSDSYSESNRATSLYTYSSNCGRSGIARCYGLSVRAVRPKQNGGGVI